MNRPRGVGRDQDPLPGFESLAFTDTGRGADNKNSYWTPPVENTPMPTEQSTVVHYGGGGGGGSHIPSSSGLKDSSAEFYQQALDAQQEWYDKIDDLYAPYRDAGQSGLDQMKEAQTVSGLDARLKEIFGSETFTALKEEKQKEVTEALANQGLFRSGEHAEEIAQIAASTGLSIESMLYGRSSDLSQLGLNATHGTAGSATNAANQISGLYAQQGQNDFNQLLQALGFQFQSGENALNREHQVGLQHMQNEFTANQNSLYPPNSGGGGGGGGSSTGQIVSGLASAAALYFSDPALKKNPVKIGSTGKLNIYEWDWIPEAPKFIQEQPRVGFMANEVMETFPEHVYMEGGYMKIDYDAVMRAN